MTQVSIANLRQLIRTLSYAVSTHAADELEDDSLSILDLENVVLTGEITERQRDRRTRETKYVIQGCTLEGIAAEVVAKVSHTGRLVIITIYVLYPTLRELRGRPSAIEAGNAELREGRGATCDRRNTDVVLCSVRRVILYRSNHARD